MCYLHQAAPYGLAMWGNSVAGSLLRSCSGENADVVLSCLIWDIGFCGLPAVAQLV